MKIKFNPQKHILLKDAQAKNKKAKVGDEIITKLEPKTDFGRIAAQTAKQVIIQRLREAERGAIFNEFKGREGEIISGVVQRREGALVFVDLGKTNGLVPPAEQMFTDNYRLGQRYRFVITKVEETSRGPVVILSRSNPKLVVGLFKTEVPEIDSGSVEVKAIAREAGSRTKIAVSSMEESIDPIGSLVGQKVSVSKLLLMKFLVKKLILFFGATSLPILLPIHSRRQKSCKSKSWMKSASTHW